MRFWDDDSWYVLHSRIIMTAVMGEFVQYGTIVEVWDDYHYCRYHNLVGGLEHFLFSHILGLSSSQLTNIFQMG